MSREASSPASERCWRSIIIDARSSGGIVTDTPFASRNVSIAAAPARLFPIEEDVPSREIDRVGGSEFFHRLVVRVPDRLNDRLYPFVRLAVRASTRHTAELFQEGVVHRDDLLGGEEADPPPHRGDGCQPPRS